LVVTNLEAVYKRRPQSIGRKVLQMRTFKLFVAKNLRFFEITACPQLHLNTCPKNDVISFSRKGFGAVGLEEIRFRQTSIRAGVLDPSFAY